MNHLYLHLPFCQSRCIYCDFVVLTDTSEQNRYTRALSKELVLYGELSPKTLYMGGGTPSTFPLKALENLLSRVSLGKAEEVTLEVNPEDVTFDKVKAWRGLGINRFSLGIQTMDPEGLLYLKRRNTQEQNFKALKIMRRACSNWSVDLLIGIPGQTWQTLRSTLQEVLTFEPPHLSLYLLEVKGRKFSCSDGDIQADLAHQAWDYLANKGYHHYEVCNFAIKGYESQHNRAYWTMAPFLGLGLGAHSFDGKRRYWNTSQLNQYVKSLEHNRLPIAGELPLTKKMRWEDAIALGLRTAEGVPEAMLEGLTWDGSWTIKIGNRLRVKEERWLLLHEFLADLWAQLDTCPIQPSDKPLHPLGVLS